MRTNKDHRIKNNAIMKKLTKLLFLSFILTGAALSSAAQVYITIRPATPVIVVTERPDPTYIWIGEEWIADGPGYKYVGGYWGKPPSAGYKYKKGYWSHGKHGHHWINGGWYGEKQKKGKKGKG
jgi:hypothetical protein